MVSTLHLLIRVQRILRVVVVSFTVAACAAGPHPEASPKRLPPLTGKGLFMLDFDYETGRVTDVHVLESTGNATLDATTIRTFKGWRCKAHTYRHVKVPINITYNRNKP
jgi:TonB family protein